MKPVFISYRRTWSSETIELAQACKFRGLPVFIDISDQSRLAGAGQYDQLRSVIAQESSGMLLYVTNDIVESATIWNVELPTALTRLEESQQFPIVPIFRNVRPGSVKDRMPVHGQRIASLGGVVSVPAEGLSDTGRLEYLRKKHGEAARIMLDLLLQGRNSARSSRSIRVGMRTREVGPSEEDAELILDWRPCYPNDVPSEETCLVIHEAAIDVSSAISKAGYHDVEIVGQAHLSAAVMLGSVFSQTAGFRLRAKQYDDWWGSEGGTRDCPLHISSSQLDPSIPDILLAIAISRPELPHSAQKALGDLDLICGGRIVIQPEGGANRQALTSGDQARDAVNSIVQAVIQARTAWGVGTLHLFLSAPFAFAILLGHSLNALGPICLYDYEKSADTYHRAFVIS